jgi:hypothetical protein
MFDSSPSSDGSGFGDVSGVVLAHLLEPSLANLAAIPDSVDGDAELVDLCVGLSRLEAWAVAARARVTQQLVSRTEDELVRHGLARHGESRGSTAGASHAYDDERMAQRTVSTDLSLALGLTPWAADREIELAAALAAAPELGVALAAGRLDRRRTELVLEELGGLTDPEARAQVLAAVVGDGSHSAEEPERRTDLIRPLRRAGTHLQQLQPATLRRAVRQECAALDADLFIRREATARAGRRIEHQALPDCMAELRVVAPGYAIAAAVSNIDLAARAARRRGDGRTLDQLRCDISVGWLTEGAFGTLVTRPAPAGTTPGSTAPRTSTTSSGSHRAAASTSTHTAGGFDPSAQSRVEAALLAMSGLADSPTTRPTFVDDDRSEVQLSRPPGALIVISMPDTTALGLDDQPATLHGPGGPSPIPAPVARRIGYDERHSTWIGLYTDPRTGIATDISPGYRPPPRQRTFVMLRDGMRSRLPSSNVRRIELDHVQAYNHETPARGGQTTAADLACAGLREHHLKTDRMLSVAGDANGPLTFTTHTGHAYVSWPELWEDPPVFTNVERPQRHRLEATAAVGDPPY